MSDPLFQFGFGLSYTAFSIGDAQVKKTNDDLGNIILSIPVTNTWQPKGYRDSTGIRS